MKKTLLFASVFVGASAFGQTFSEDFEGLTAPTLPAGWSQVTAATDGGYLSLTDISSTYFAVPAHTDYVGTNDDNCNCDKSNEQLLSATFNLPAATQVLTFDYALGLYYGETGKVGITTDGGATVTNLQDLAPTRIAGADHDWFTASVSLAGYENTMGAQIVFTYDDNADWGSGMAIDDVLIEDLPANELELVSIDNAANIGPGATDIIFTVTNNGANDVTSFDVTYNDGSGDVTANVTGAALAFGQSAQYTHPTQWTAVASTSNTIDVTIDLTGDTDASNDMLSTTIDVATGAGTKLPLLELFTSSTCPPCYSLNYTGYDGGGLNAGLDGLNANDEATAEIAVVKYQVNWPGSGDHAYNAEIGTRVSHYGITGAPTSNMDGTAESMSPAVVANYQGNFALVDVAGTYTLDGDNISVDATVTPYANISGAIVHIALLEKNYAATADASFSNGETEFHHAVRKMLPDASGTTANLTAGTDFTVNETYTRTVNAGLPAQGSFDFHTGTDLEVVIFVEDPATKTIYNAGVATLDAGSASINENNATFGLASFPNPTTGLSNIVVNTAESANVEIQVLSVLGEVVFSNNANVTAGENMFNVDLSNVSNGVYFANVMVNGNVQTIKINVAK